MNKDFDSIYLTGVATCGKDTAYSIIKELVYEHVFLERQSLADDLKLFLDPFIKEHFNISAFTRNPAEKQLIRNLFVEFGKIKRIQSNGTYWWKLLQPKIESSIKEGYLPCITDLRYAFYENDELYWSQNINKGVIVHITRFDKNNNQISAPNDQEKENDPKIESAADFKLVWPSSDNISYLKDIVRAQLGDLLEMIKNKYGKTNRPTIIK